MQLNSKRHGIGFIIGLVVAMVMAQTSITSSEAVIALSSKVPDLHQKVSINERYGKLPLAFEINQGQAGKQVDFLSRGKGYNLFLTPTDAYLSLSYYEQAPDATSVKSREPNLQKTKIDHVDDKVKASIIQMKIIGANPKAKVEGLAKLPGKRNYLIGKDPKKWKTHVPTFAKVQYKAIYPGVDLVYYGNQQRLEYDFIVAPGADPKSIRLGFTGARHMQVDKQGDLIVALSNDETISFQAPVIYQLIKGEQKEIQGRYILTELPSKNKGKLVCYEVAFNVGAYDASLPLIIDPVLDYSTRVGGSGADAGYAVAVHTYSALQKRAFITGFTSGTADFPGTGIGIVAGYAATQNIFVAKFNPAGDALEYGTYIGGEGSETGTGIAVDDVGCAYVTGYTDSINFPTTNGEYDTFGGSEDAFVLRLYTDGASLVYSTYLGGAGVDRAWDIDLLEVPNPPYYPGWSVYIAGETFSYDFPDGGGDRGVFAARMLTDSGYFGWITVLESAPTTGQNSMAKGIAVDGAGYAYITGRTLVSSFPTTTGAFQEDLGGGFDAFIAKLDPLDGTTVYATFLGGSNSDLAEDIAVDGQGNAYVVGTTYSDDFPATPDAYQPNLAPCAEPASDAFVAKLNPAGTDLVYATYLGGAGPEEGYGIALDTCDNAYVTGFTSSSYMPECTPTTFPQVSALPGAGDCENDAFVAKLDAWGGSLNYATCLGGVGSTYDRGYGIAVSGSDAFVVGSAESSNFPGTTLGLGGTEAFVTKISGVTQSLEFSDLEYTAYENDGAVTITVSRYSGISGAVSVDFTTVDGTAIAGDDYIQTQGVLDWEDQDDSDKTFTVSIIDDRMPESEKTVGLLLKNPTGNAELGCATAVYLTIYDDDEGPLPPSEGYYTGGGGGGAGIGFTCAGNSMSNPEGNVDIRPSIFIILSLLVVLYGWSRKHS